MAITVAFTALIERNGMTTIAFNPESNPYANEPLAQEAVEFLYNLIKPHNPEISKDVIWAWYIENRPEVEEQNKFYDNLSKNPAIWEILLNRED